ncbi:hypothetical protein BVC80_8727g6 [Macleaya cordata]|uniref:Uncharacterized protein n=1 Tax=Macleaya cordata TaxID=56857 RepID=A0A200Q8L7_MACCD|nr:hypothetical protein BVC80_8727g6 [Macleaya cordata]
MAYPLQDIVVGNLFESVWKRSPKLTILATALFEYMNCVTRRELVALRSSLCLLREEMKQERIGHSREQDIDRVETEMAREQSRVLPEQTMKCLSLLLRRIEEYFIIN